MPSYVENYDYLVLAPGSKPIVPKLPGANAPGVFILRDIPDSNQVRPFPSLLFPRSRSGLRIDKPPLLRSSVEASLVLRWLRISDICI